MKRLRPLLTATRLPPLVTACVLGASACSSLNGNGVNNRNGGDAGPAPQITGIPTGLIGQAQTVVRSPETPPRSVLEARNYASQQAERLEELLATEGYLAAAVTTAPIEDPLIAPTLLADPGPLFRIASVRVDGADALDAAVQQATETVLLLAPPGAPARANEIETVESELVRLLRTQGYAFATSRGIDALASRDDATVEITYLIDPGPRVRLGRMDLPDDITTRHSSLGNLQTWQDGELYRPQTIERFRGRLRGTGVFDGIGVTVSEEPDPDGTHPVIVQLVEGKHRTIGAGVTASTTDGTGVDAFWERRNFTGRSDTVRIQAEAATISRGLSASYERPNIGRFGRTLKADAGWRQQETPAFDLTGIRTGLSISQPLTRQLSVSVGAAVDVTRTRDLRARILQKRLRDQVTFSLPLSATYSDVDDVLDPSSGFRLFAGIEPGITTGDTTSGYTRILTAGSTYYQLTDRLVAAIRGEYGAYLGTSAIPPDRLFFAGGGGTIRGYEFQSVSPRAPDGTPVGGKGLFVTSGELRWRQSERFGYVMFVDAGQAADTRENVFSDIRYSLGAGVRYYPGFGPIRLDIATPIDRRRGESPVQVYISIGQAF